MGPTQKAAKTVSGDPLQQLADLFSARHTFADYEQGFRAPLEQVRDRITDKSPRTKEGKARMLAITVLDRLGKLSASHETGEITERQFEIRLRALCTSARGLMEKTDVQKENEFLPTNESGPSMLIYEGMAIQMDGPYQKQARRVADVLRTINLLLPEGMGVQRVEIAAGFPTDREGYLNHVVRIPSIYMDKEDDLLLFAFHEAAHCLLEQSVGEDRKKELASLWRELVDTLEVPLPGYRWKDGSVKSYDAVTENMDDDAFEKLEGLPLIRLFDESGYVKSDRDAGHPYDDYEELFASASNVMRNFPEEFVKRLLELKAANPQEYRIAARVAAAVLSAWSEWDASGSDLFSQKIKDALGQ